MEIKTTTRVSREGEKRKTIEKLEASISHMFHTPPVYRIQTCFCLSISVSGSNCLSGTIFLGLQEMVEVALLVLFPLSVRKKRTMHVKSSRNSCVLHMRSKNLFFFCPLGLQKLLKSQVKIILFYFLYGKGEERKLDYDSTMKQRCMCIH